MPGKSSYSPCIMENGPGIEDGFRMNSGDMESLL